MLCYWLTRLRLYSELCLRTEDARLHTPILKAINGALLSEMSPSVPVSALRSERTHI